MGADITIVTHAALAEGSRDDQVLAEAFAEAGRSVRCAVWDNDSVEWDASAVTIVRSTWDYHLKPGAWFRWLDHVATQTRLINPAPLMAWNSDKRYLGQLAALGVPVVPTEYLRRGVPIRLIETARRRGWNACVIKPTIAASSRGAARFESHELADAGQAHMDRLLEAGDVMVQPFIPNVLTELERSMVVIGADVASAFVKPAFAANATGDTALQVHVPTPTERELASRVLAALPHRATYARVDVVPTSEGPLLMELELIEPDLGFRLLPDAARLFASACLRASGRT